MTRALYAALLKDHFLKDGKCFSPQTCKGKVHHTITRAEFMQANDLVLVSKTFLRHCMSCVRNSDRGERHVVYAKLFKLTEDTKKRGAR